MDRFKQFLNKYKELILYVFIGGLTTLVNFSFYFILKNIFGLHYVISNIFAVSAAIIFAYVTNKFVVFRDKTNDLNKLVLQFLSFIALRLVSGAAETLLMVLFVERFSFNEDVVKIVVAFLIVALNYIFSKLLIFKKNN